MATREQQRAFYAAFGEAFPWATFTHIPLGKFYGPDFVDIVVVGTEDGVGPDLVNFLNMFEPAISRPDYSGGEYWSFPTESLDAAIQEMAVIAARVAEEEANRERLDDLFYRALILAAPDLDYTVIPRDDDRDETVVFRINGPVSEGLNSILGLRRHPDPETGEDVCAIDIDDLEETTEDLRDLADDAEAEGAAVNAEAEATADRETEEARVAAAVENKSPCGKAPKLTPKPMPAKPRKRAIDLGPPPPRRRVRPKKA